MSETPRDEAKPQGLLHDLKLGPAELEIALAKEVRRVLGQPKKKTLPQGMSLLIEHQPVEGIWFVHQGEVKLFRMVDGREIVFHQRTVGPVVGLLSLALQGEASYNAVAATDIEATYVSFTDLDVALKKSPVLLGYVNALLLRSFAQRQRRSAELHIEVNRLNRDIQAERDHLAEVLQNLKRTQTRLVESEKMATLGQLSAGVAHDLNNPVAAMQRSTEYLSDDLRKIAPDLPEGALFQSCMDENAERGSVSTREEREARKLLEEALGDTVFAKRLVKAGIYSAAEYEKYFNGLKGDAREARLRLMELASRVGGALRNMRSCSNRILDLVKSLKAYARADSDCEVDCDLNRCLSDTLLLFKHALKEVELVKVYGELPTINCYSGELNQVWTNLISNALEAMENKGRLEIRSEPFPAGGVAIHIIDSGPGIPDERIEQIFDLNFSTKKGQINFGLGIGLSICKQIVTRNGGHIEVDSRPGYTDFVVVLPENPPERRSSTAVVPDTKDLE